MKQMKNPGRFAGILYLGIIVFGVFTQVAVREKLIVSGNPAETASNILENASLFRIGFVTDILMICCFLSLGFVLYIMFRDVSRDISVVVLGLNIVGTVILAFNMLSQYGALMVLEADYLTSFSKEQLEGVSLMLMDFHRVGYDIGIIGFGAWLFPIGYLIIKSKAMPKLIGIFMMAGGISFMLYLIVGYAFPELKDTVAMIDTVCSSLGEFSFALWLLVFGIRWEKIQVPEPALAV